MTGALAEKPGMMGPMVDMTVGLGMALGGVAVARGLGPVALPPGAGPLATQLFNLTTGNLGILTQASQGLMAVAPGVFGLAAVTKVLGNLADLI